MKAMSLAKPGCMRTVEIPEPKPGTAEVLIEVGYVGLCGSDLNAYRGASPMVTYPRIIGHEVGGTILDRGDGVPEGVRIGAKATVSPYSHCGACPACRKGRTNCCQFNQTLGVQRDGALAERIAIHHSKVHLSDALSVKELALVEPLSVGYHATNVGRIDRSDTVLVLGCGAVGLGVVAAVSHKGAAAIGLDVDDNKLEMARRLGAQHTINSAAEDVAERVADITDGEGVDVSVEAAGAPATYRMALELTASAGRVVCIGYAKEPVDLDTRQIVSKELDVRGSRNALDEFPSVIAMLEQRERPFGDMISRVAAFEEAPQAFADWSASPGEFNRILVEVSEQSVRGTE
jgi:threonine dehydrogenase-like Zn-dependent dehydrogenase